MISHRCFPTNLFNSSVESTLKLEIVIRVENVMLPIVLVLMDNLDFAQPLFEQSRFFPRMPVRSISVSTPLEEDFSQIRLALPVASIQQG